MPCLIDQLAISPSIRVGRRGQMYRAPGGISPPNMSKSYFSRLSKGEAIFKCFLYLVVLDASANVKLRG